MILVTGATGKVGSETVRLLREGGHAVRALVRNPDKASGLAALGAEVVKGDLEAPAAVAAAMTGISGVVLVTPGMPPLEMSVIAGARSADVRHLVKISNYNPSAESPVPWRRWHTLVEGELARSGLGYTVVRPNFYMQNILAMVPQIARTSSFGSPLGKGRLGMIDTRDVAAAAAAIITSPADHLGKTYTVTGPELRSYDDVAAVLSKVLGKTITYRAISFEDNKKGMTAAGVPEGMADAMNEMFKLLSTDEAAVVTEDLPKIIGRPGRTFAEFARDFAKAFAA